MSPSSFSTSSPSLLRTVGILDQRFPETGLIGAFADNITYYKCDVSKWEEVEAVSKQIIEEVCKPVSAYMRGMGLTRT